MESKRRNIDSELRGAGRSAGDTIEAVVYSKSSVPPTLVG